MSFFPDLSKEFNGDGTLSQYFISGDGAFGVTSLMHQY
jgi:hypothetical protein